MSKKTKRTRYAVVANRMGWTVKVDGKQRAIGIATQAEAILIASALARALWRDAGIPAELSIHGKDGRIRDKRTYGRDPRKTKG